MSAGSIARDVRVVDAGIAPWVVAFLERPEQGFSQVDAVLRHQQLLTALDRGEYRRLLVWPEIEPAAVAHLNTAGTLLMAGVAEAGPSFAGHLQGSGWRVLLGDAPLANEFLAATGRWLRRKRVDAREQRFMLTEDPALLPDPNGLRRAVTADLETVTELACRLHVEDRMGPPLSRNSRAGVAQRMRQSIDSGATWVVERDGAVVAKVDVSLRTRRRGAQIAGVYVEQRLRRHGIAQAAVASIARTLIAEGLPGVTLHVRADNLAGRRAYERAGFIDRGAWTLALR